MDNEQSAWRGILGTLGVLSILYLGSMAHTAAAQAWSEAQQAQLRTYLEKVAFAFEGRPQSSCTRFDTPDGDELAKRRQAYFASLPLLAQAAGGDNYAQAHAQALNGMLAWNAEYGKEAEEAFRKALDLVPKDSWRPKQAGEEIAAGAGYAWRLARVLDETSEGENSAAPLLYQQAVEWYGRHAPEDTDRIEALLGWGYSPSVSAKKRIEYIEQALALYKQSGKDGLRAMSVQAWGRLLTCFLELDNWPRNDWSEQDRLSAARMVLPHAETALAALHPGDMNDQAHTFVMTRVAETVARDQQWSRFPTLLEALRRRQAAVLERGTAAGALIDKAQDYANALILHHLELLWRVATAKRSPDDKLALPLPDTLRLFALADFLKGDAVTAGLLAGAWERQRLAPPHTGQLPAHTLWREGCPPGISADLGEFTKAQDESAERLGAIADGPVSRGLAATLANHLAADEMYLQLTVLPGWLVIGRVTCDRFGIRAIHLKDNKTLQNKLQEWRRNLGSSSPPKEMQTIGQELLELGLARMFEEIPTRVQRIFVSSDDVLTGIPLGALPLRPEQRESAEAPRWAAQRWIFLVTGNASNFVLARQSPTAVPHTLALFAMGNSGGGWKSHAALPLPTTPDQRRLALVLQAAGNLEPLESYKREILQLAEVVGRQNIHPRLNGDATLAAFNHEDISRAAIIAIAAHGISPPAEPTDVSMVLLEPGNEAEAGLLTPTQILHGRPLSADLVVLSACNTMTMDINIKSRLYASLPAAFLAQGAHAVLATGWKLGDDYAAKFVPDLVARYQRETGGDIAAAYANAQRAAITAGEPTHHWATWMLIGDPRRQTNPAAMPKIP